MLRYRDSDILNTKIYLIYNYLLFRAIWKMMLQKQKQFAKRYLSPNTGQVGWYYFKLLARA